MIVYISGYKAITKSMIAVYCVNVVCGVMWFFGTHGVQVAGIKVRTIYTTIQFLSSFYPLLSRMDSPSIGGNILYFPFFLIFRILEPTYPIPLSLSM